MLKFECKFLFLALKKLPYLPSEQLTIQEAAAFLKVSAMTLRRWEERGILIPLRTVGNQRRYVFDELLSFKEAKKSIRAVASVSPVVDSSPFVAPVSLQTPVASETQLVAPAPLPVIEPTPLPTPALQPEPVMPPTTPLVAAVEPHQEEETLSEEEEETDTSWIVPEKKSRTFRFPSILPQHSLVGISSMLGVMAILFVILYVTRGTVHSLLTQTPAKAAGNESVLAASTSNQKLRFTVHIPSLFKKDTEFLTNITVDGKTDIKGSLAVQSDANFFHGIDTNNTNINAGRGTVTASNIIYSLTAGTGITITGGQRPTISATDAGSSQAIFKNVKVGSSTVTAGSNNDTLELAAGSGISLSADTSGKKITITNSNSTSNQSGFTDDGSVVRLTDSTDKVGIGTTTPTEALSVSGNVTVSGNIQLGGDTISDLTGAGLTVSSNKLLVNLLGSVDGASGVTSSHSGLEFGSAGNALTLLQGCSNNQILKWDDAAGVWSCANDSGGATGVVNVAEGGTVYSSIDTIQFDTLDFNATTSASQANITIDYANSGITRKNQNETISGNWTYSSASPLTFSNTAAAISLADSGVLTIQDTAGTPHTLLTLSDAGTTGNLAVTGTISAATTGTINGINISTGAVSNVTNLTITSGGDLTIGSIGLNDVGTSNVTSGASLIGVFDEFTNSSSSTVQGVLHDFDSALGSGASKWQITGNAYSPLGAYNTVADLLLGSTATTSAKFGFLNVNPGSGTPTASVSAQNANGNAVFLTANGNLATANKTSLTLGGGDTGNIILGGFAAGVLQTNASGVISTGSVSVANGGTGATSLTANAVLIGNGTSAVGTVGPGTNGQIFVGNTSGAPTFVTLGGDASLNSGTGALTIASDAVALGTDTTGNYVADVAAGDGLSVTGTAAEGWTPTLSVNTTDITGCTSTTTSKVIWDNTAKRFICATDQGSGSGGSKFSQNGGVLFPNEATVDDLLLGGTATSSAKFAFVNVNSGTPTASISAIASNNALSFDALGNITTSNKQSLTLGGGDTGNIVLSGFGTGLIKSTSGVLSLATSGTDYEVPLTFNTGLNRTGNTVTNTDPGSAQNIFKTIAVSGQSDVVTDQNSDTLTLAAGTNITITTDATTDTVTFACPSCVTSGGAGASKWTQTSGVLYPNFASTLDLLVGGTSTASAKFAVLNVDSGTPMASVSAQNGAGQAVYIDSRGAVQSTAYNTLTLGGSTTGNVVINSRGNIALTASGANLIGAGTLTGLTGLTSSGTIQFSGLTTNGVVYTTGGNGTLNSEAQLALSRGGTNGDLSGIATGSLIYKGASALAGTGALTGILQGNGLSAPTAITGTAGRLAKWGSSSPYLADSVIFDDGTNVGIGTTTPLSKLDVNGSASVSGNLTFSSAASIQTSAQTTLTLGGSNTGNIVVSPIGGSGALSLNLGSLSVNGTAGVTISSAGQCVTTTNGIVTGTGACQPGNEPINMVAGTLQEANTTLDLLLGGTATTSAKFGFLNVNPGSGTPTASISAQNANGNAIFLKADGTLATANDTTLTLGGSTTGNIVIDSGTGNITLSDATTASGLLTANAGLTIASGQNLTLSGLNGANGVLYADTSGVVSEVTATTTGSQCLMSGAGVNGVPSWSACPGSGSGASKWTLASGNILYPNTISNQVGIGTTTASDVTSSLYVTHDLASGALGKALAIFNQTENQDLLTASASGVTQFAISNNGNLRMLESTGATFFGTLAVGDLTSDVTYTLPMPSVGSAANICLSTGNCAGAGGGVTGTGTNNFLAKFTSTGSTIGDSLLFDDGTNVGIGTTTPLAKLGVNGSASVSGNLTFSSAASIQTSAQTTLTLGGSDTGNIVVSPIGGSGALSLNVGSLSVNGTAGVTISSAGQCVTTTNGIVTGTGACQPGNEPINMVAGTLQEANTTLDLLLGGTATSSAKFGFLNVNPGSGTPTASVSAQDGSNRALAIDAFGNITTSNKQSLTLGGGDTGNIVFSGFAAGVLQTNASGVVSSTIGSDGQVLSVSGGALTWVSSGAVNFWQRNLGTLAPDQITNDLLLGGTATSSAKFAFINVAGGTPTASISANSGNNALFVDGAGNISTTNRQSLVLGNSSTYNTTGNILLNPNGTGNVGVGTTNPQYRFQVRTGTNENLQVRSSSSPTGGIFLNASNDADNAVVPMQFQASLFNFSSGNIGIGITNPGFPLNFASTLGDKISLYNTSGVNYGLGVQSSLLQIHSDVIGSDIAFGYGSSTAFTENMRIKGNGNVGIGTTAPAGLLSVSGAVTGQGLLQLNETGDQNIFTASASGTTVLSLSHAGVLTPGASNTYDLGLTGTTFKTGYFGTDVKVAGVSVCLQNGTNCQAGAGNYWDQYNSGSLLAPKFASVADLVLGGTATASAKFAVLNMNSGTPTASIAAVSIPGATYITADGTLGTTSKQALTINASGDLLLQANGSSLFRSPGTNNMFFGASAGNTTLSSSENVTMGGFSGFALSSGGSNTLIGYFAGKSINTGSSNTFLGDQTGKNTTNGSFNTFIGQQSGNNNTSGQQNAFLGYQAGYTNNTGNYNVYLGYNSGGSAGTNSSIAIGTNALITADNQLVIGSNSNGSITDAYLGQGVTTGSPAGITLNATGGTGSNNVGGNLFIAGGKGTGSANGGRIGFETSAAGTTGTTLNGLTERMSILANGNVGIGTTAPAGLLSVSGAVTGQALVQLNETGDQDIFVASASGSTIFRVSRTSAFVNGSAICTLNGTNCPAGTTTYWDLTAGNALTPKNSTYDLLLGGTATSSAKFAVLNMAGNTPTASISAQDGSNRSISFDAFGNIKTTNNQTLTLGAAGTGSVILAPGGTTALTASGANLSAAGTLGVTGLITANGGLTIPNGKTTTFGSFVGKNSVLYTSETTGVVNAATTASSSQCLVSDAGGSGIPGWTSCSGAAGSTQNLWQLNSGALSPFTSSPDLLLGSTATASAKFGFLNVNSGTPTASISAQDGSSSTLYLTANGKIATTAKQNLTLGDSTTTGNVYINPSGNLSLKSGIKLLPDSDATNAINIANNAGTSFVSFDTSNLGVGIGTSSLGGAKLKVSGGRIEVTDGSSNNGVLSYAGSDIVVGALSTGTGLELWSNGSNKVTIDTSGYVGIGLTNPVSLLSNTSSLPGGWVAASDSLVWKATGTGGYAASVYAAPTSGNSFGLRVQTSGATSSDYPLVVGNDTNNLLTLLGNGQLSLGAGLTPDSFLDVRGAVKGKALALFNEEGDQNIFTASASGATKFVIGNAGDVTINASADVFGNAFNSSKLRVYNGDIGLMDSSDNDARISVSTNGLSLAAGASNMASGENINLCTASCGSVDNRVLVIDSSHRLGVGTDTPVSELHVTRPTTLAALGKALAIFDQTESQDILTASASGTTRLTLNNAGQLQLATQGSTGGLMLGGETQLYRSAANQLTMNASLLPSTDNTYDLGSSPSARFRNVYVGPGSMHIQCTVVDGCGQGLDYALGVNTTTGNFQLGVNGTSGAPNALLTIEQGGKISIAGSLNVVGNVSANGIAGSTIASAACVITSNGIVTGSAACPVGTSGGAFTLDTSNGVIAPNITTPDFVLGGLATSSAKFAVLHINSGTPTATLSGSVANANLYINGDGLLGTTSNQSLTLGASGTGNVILAPGGTTALTASGANVTLAGNLTLSNSAGTTGFGGLTYTWPTAAIGGNGYILTTTTGGALSWVDPGTLPSSNFWDQYNGGSLLAPKFATVADLVLGGTATNSAKFGFLNVNSGTPTASISAQDGSNKAFSINANGVLATTNNQTLTLGATGTGNIALAPNGSTAMTLLGNGNIGIGTTTPVNKLGIAGGVAIGSYAGSSTAPTNGAIISGIVGIGTTSPLATLDVRGQSGTTPVASVAGTTAMSALVVDNSGVGDIFTASHAGATKFTIANNGNVTGVGTKNVFSGTPTSTANYGVLNLGNNPFDGTSPSYFVGSTGGTVLAVNTAVAPTTYLNAVLTDSPTIYYRLNETSGTTATDSSGNSHNASYVGGYTLNQSGATADGDKAIGVSGESVYYASSTGLPTGNSARSEELWFKGTGTGFLTYYGNFSTSQDWGLAVDSANQILVQTWLNNHDFTTTTSLTDGNWHHLVVTYDGVTVTVYVDGTAQGGTWTPGTLSTNPAANGLKVGSRADGSGPNYVGNIDDISIYSTSLTSGQVLTHYQAGVGTLVGFSGNFIDLQAAGASKFAIDNTGNLTLGSGDYIRPTANSTHAINIANAAGTSFASFDTSNQRFGIGTTAPLAKLDVNGTASVGGSLTFYGGAQSIQTSANAALTLGGNSTGNITLAPLNGIAGSYIAPSTNGNVDLGTSSLAFRNIYAGNLYASGTSGQFGWFQRNNGTVEPTNITDDLLLGATATTSAKFAFLNNAGGTPTASISAQDGSNKAFSINANGVLATTNNQTLTVGATGTGNITLAPNGSTAMTVLGNGRVGVGTGSPLATLDIRGNSGTTPVASVAGTTAMSALVVDNSGVGDIFTASNSGSTKFTIANNGNVTGVGTKNVFSGTPTATANYGELNIGPSAFDGTTTGHFTGSVNGTVLAMNAPSAPSYVNTVTGDSPAVYYRLDETSGTTAADSSGNGRNATYTGGYTLNQTGATADGDQAIGVSGKSVQYAAATGLPLGNANRSVELWFKTTQGGYLLDWGQSSSSNNDFAIGVLSSTNVYILGWSHDLNLNTGVQLEDGAYHHLIVTWDGSTIRVYVDGALRVSQATSAYNTTTTASGLVIGNRQDNTVGFTGNIDDVAIYSSVLSDTQVSSHYQAGSQTVAYAGSLADFQVKGVTKLKIDGTGSIITANGTMWKPITDSTTALGIADSTGLKLVDFDTTNSRVGIGTTAPLAKLDVNGTASVGGSLTFYGGATSMQTTNNAVLTLGGNSTGNITLAPLNGIAGAYVAPSTNGNVDLGTSSLAFRNIYAGNLYASGTSGQFGWFQRNNGTVEPTNITDDLLLGATATSSAKFGFLNVNSGTPTASISGSVANANLYINGDGLLGTTSNHSLTLGATGTGNIALAPNGSTAMTVLGNGKVGIGTTAPSEELNIYNGNEQISYGNLKFTTVPAPSAPTVAVNATAGNLNGTYYYEISFVTANGETEGGATSSSVSPANQQVDLTSIPTGTSGVVTARKIYRTSAGATTDYKLVATINDNTTTTYTDNVADGSRTTNIAGRNTTGGTLYLDGTMSLNMTHSLNNSFAGYSAGAANTTGTFNTAFGDNAFPVNTTGAFNTAFGQSALYSNTTGNNNTAFGQSALNDNSNGSGNTAFGASALFSNTSGTSNTAVGLSALYSNNIGIYNIAIGDYAMQFNTSGSYNMAIGHNALGNNQTGNNNIALGYQAGYVSTADNNVYIGYQTGYSTTGAGNVFLGYQAGYNETGSNKLYVANSSTSNPLIYGNFAASALGINTSAGGNAALAINQVNGSGDIVTASASGVTKFALSNSGEMRLFDTDASNYTGFVAPSALNGNYVYTMPNPANLTGVNGYILSTNGTGVLSWMDPGTLPNSDKWDFNAGVYSPKYASVGDFALGGTATASAKFAVLHMNSGTPTASLSANSGNNALFVDGAGNISTTNRQSLVLGNSSTYNSTGNILLNPNGTGNVGIGVTAPASALQVGGGSNGAITDIAQFGSTGAGANTENRIILGGDSTHKWAGLSGIDSGSSNEGYLGFYTLHTGTLTKQAFLDNTGSLFLDAQGNNNGTFSTALVFGGAGSGEGIASKRTATGNQFGLDFYTNNTNRLAITQTGNIGIGTTAPIARLQLKNSGATAIGKALAIFDQYENQDIFTASASGVTKFALSSSGEMRLFDTDASNYTGFVSPGALNGNYIYTMPNPATLAGVNGYILSTNGSGVLSWLDPGTLPSSNFWDQYNGGSLLAPKFATVADLVLGGTATSSAKFGFLNVNSGTPTASISANSGNNGLYLTGDGTLATNNRQSLVLGNSSTYNSTGNILLNPNGTGKVGIGTTNPFGALNVVTSSSDRAGYFQNTWSGGGAYGVMGSATGTGSNNYGGYFGASGAGSNVGIWVDGPAASGVNWSIYSTGLAQSYINGSLGIGNQTPPSQFYVTRSLSSGVTGKALAILDQLENQDILTASGSGTTRFTVGNDGRVAVGVNQAASFLNAFNVSGHSKGNALALFNEVGSNDILTASASGTTRFTLANDGSITQTATTTTGTGYTLNVNALTTGKGFNLSSTSTAFTTGSLGYIDWSPGSATTATGDLLTLNVGSNGTLGNIFNIKDGGNSVFSVSQTAVTSSLPVNFTSPGDVAMAYDLNFTNPTASYINSSAPLYVRSGETFNSSNLTLSTYNSGQVVIDGSFNGTNITDAATGITTSTTRTVSGRGMVYYLSADSGTSNTTQTTTFNITGLPDIDGTIAFINSRAIKGATGGSQTNTVIIQINGTQVSTVATATGTGASTVIENYTIVRSNGAWRISSTSTNSDSADLAEWMPYSGEQPQVGDVVTISDNGAVVMKSNAAYDTKLIGIVSTNPNTVLGANTGNSVRVALAGRVPVNVSTENGPINKGDYLTSSSVPGVAMKATQKGTTIGKALASYNASGVGSIDAFVNTSWYDPEIAISSTGDLQIVKDATSNTYSLTQNGTAVTSIGAFGQVLSATTQTGSMSADMVTTNSLTVHGKSLDDYIKDATSSISSQLDSLTTRIETLEQQASASAMFNDMVSGNATQAAQMKLLDVDQLNVKTATVSGDLSVLGRTVVNDLGVTGNITTGILSIRGLEGEVNALGTLKLQANGFGDVDILAGKVTIANNGDITTVGEITAKKINLDESDTLSKSVGEAVIKAGMKSVDITTTALTAKSHIFVTPETPVLVGAARKTGTSYTFTISMPRALTKDLKVSWWIVN